MVKNVPANAGDAEDAGDGDSVRGWGRSPVGGAWQPTPVFWPGESHGLEPGRLQSIGSHRVRQTEVT